MNAAKTNALRSEKTRVATGKTRVLTCRVAYLVKDCGIKPEDLIVVTFTNKVGARTPPRRQRQPVDPDASPN